MTVTPTMRDRLIKAALEARAMAYAPYSKFRVGAAVLTEDGAVITGANVENASYGATICAERAAVVRACACGQTTFCAIAVAGFRDDEAPEERPYAYPCGVCRQVLMEFCAPSTPVFVAVSCDRYEATTLGQLLPHAFGPGALGERSADDVS